MRTRSQETGLGARAPGDRARAETIGTGSSFLRGRGRDSPRPLFP